MIEKLNVELCQLEAETFEVEEIYDLDLAQGAASTSCSTSCSSTTSCSCSTSSCCTGTSCSSCSSTSCSCSSSNS